MCVLGWLIAGRCLRRFEKVQADLDELMANRQTRPVSQDIEDRCAHEQIEAPDHEQTSLISTTSDIIYVIARAEALELFLAEQKLQEPTIYDEKVSVHT